MTVLITAGTGLIGANVARLLATEWDERIVILNRRQVSIDGSILADVSDHLEWVYGSVTDLSFLLRTVKRFSVDSIVHCAALLPQQEDAQRPVESLETNVLGTANVLEASYVMGLRRVLVMSSAAVMGDPEDLETPRREDDIVLPPAGMYALTKLTGEYLVHNYREVYDIDAVTLRPMTVWGPGRWEHLIHPVPGLINAVASGQEVIKATGADTRFDLTYVKDEAAGVIAALQEEKRLPHYVYNLSYGKNVSIAEVVEILRAEIPGARIEVGPGLWEGVMARGRQHGTVYRSSQRPPQDISRAQSDFHYKPVWPIERAIPDFVRWLHDGIYGAVR